MRGRLSKSDHVCGVALYVDARPFQEFAFLFLILFLSLSQRHPVHVVTASLVEREHSYTDLYCLLMAALSIIRDQSLQANEPRG